MKHATIFSPPTVLLLTLLLCASCTSPSYLTSMASGDDLYTVHDHEAIALEAQREAEIARAAVEARQARIEAMIADAEAREAEQYYSDNYSNPYEEILADDYESAYERRLRGFSSPTYRLPSSYYTYRYSDAWRYASAYDPAFYNVIVMGDEVWVEPRYITALFGGWGTPTFNFSFGWGWPYAWGFGWNYGLGWPYYGWGGPYYSWGWSWPYWYPPYWGGHWHGYYGPRVPVTHRPGFGGDRGYSRPTGGRPVPDGNYTPSRNFNRGGISSGRNRSTTTDRNNRNSYNRRPATTRPATTISRPSNSFSGGTHSSGGGSVPTRNNTGGRGR